MKRLDRAGRESVADVAAGIDGIAGIDGWNAAALEDWVRAFAETRNLKLGKVAQPLRAARTGAGTSPPIFEAMAILGRAETPARLPDAAGPPPPYRKSVGEGKRGDAREHLGARPILKKKN